MSDLFKGEELDPFGHPTKRSITPEEWKKIDSQTTEKQLNEMLSDPAYCEWLAALAIEEYFKRTNHG